MSEMLLNGIPFDDYLEKYEIFEKTTQFMMDHLKKIYDNEPEDFQREMRADYRTVAETYQFKRKIAALEKNYMYDTPVRYYVAIYTAIFDLNGKFIDDLMR